MLHLVLLAPLMVSSLQVGAAGQGDDEFDFGRRPRRPAPIPDDFDDMPGDDSSRSPERLPSRRVPNERYRDRDRQPPAGRRPVWEVPIAARNLPVPPLKYVFAGSRGRFSVIGGSGQAAYQRQQQAYLVGLRYVRRDERFSYWAAAAGDSTVGQWAFARRAGSDGRHTVWQRTPAGWQYFDNAQVSKPR